MQQRTDEWYQARLGKLTASRFADVMGGAEARKRYACEILQEIVTGHPADDGIVTPAMEWGNQHESLAVTHYQFQHDSDTVIECGFFVHPNHNFIGASPDRLVGFDGLLEVKCPYYTRNHIYAIHFGAYHKHKPQVQGQLWVTERLWCDLVSFDPRFEEQPLHIERVYRDESYIKKLEEQLCHFWHCIDRRKLNEVVKPYKPMK